jgi:hypothetical protein
MRNRDGTISAELPTQSTDAIRPIVTGKLPVTLPPVSRIVHIASIEPSLIDLMPARLPIVLAGFRMGYSRQRVIFESVVYTIEDIWADPAHIGKILARLERLQEDA